MGAFEKFLNDQPDRTPILIKTALSHVQFETIHPFLDGNGRIGRLLITLLLCRDRILRHPLLYLSLYFKQHRDMYFDLLMRVRMEGDWEAWLEFFVKGVREMADGAVETACRLNDIFIEDRITIQGLGRGASSAIRLHQLFQHRPIASARFLVDEAHLSPPTVGAALRALQEVKIIEEVTGRKRKRLYAYKRYLRLMSEGTESQAL